ncbi:hypothetical protein [Leptolyngbya iicbica]|uniref:Uncharacterized protein n=2 Tax=Cyanophyceae TaxID=3028117 RepID=A0A4Q7EFM4_9CYAN|nr:hypothetical protein [Leptolyngbya sp. LK]RZM82043.1 hypothetical protein DYY88_01905 [Leptolyngbya sp. LK]
MTNAQSNDDIESRLTRIESLLMNTAALANRNATDFDRMLAAFDTIRETLSNVAAVTQRNALDIDALTQDIRRNAADIRAMSQRVDSLAAAGERHDRILDYLLRREAGDIDPE